jgi:hypothetical protein
MKQFLAPGALNHGDHSHGQPVGIYWSSVFPATPAFLLAATSNLAKVRPLSPQAQRCSTLQASGTAYPAGGFKFEHLRTEEPRRLTIGFVSDHFTYNAVGEWFQGYYCLC